MLSGTLPIYKKIGLISLIITTLVNYATYRFISFEVHCIVGIIFNLLIILYIIYGLLNMLKKEVLTYINKVKKSNNPYVTVFAKILAYITNTRSMFEDKKSPKITKKKSKNKSKYRLKKK